jgi:magnesium chelatase family protein
MDMVAKVGTVALVGFEGALVEIETDSKQGLPGIQIVGMGNKAVDEARERVRSAITNSLLSFPPRKLTINLAPAELPKDGAHFDLPIALSVLVASGQLRQTEVDKAIFAGELALDGVLRPIRGAISIAETCRNAGITRVFVPRANAEQAALIEGIEVIGVENLKELYLHLKQEVRISPTIPSTIPAPTPVFSLTIDDINGQEQAKRALQIASAGRHNILLSGPPGAGKTMLATALVSLLPPLSPSEQLEVTKIHSLAGEIETGITSQRPFRSPHHTTSPIAIIGGGSKPRPGEISLAHLGVLFLDELPEYSRSTLESLRQPLEDKVIRVTRAHGRTTYPANFMLVATMNPCPCGYYGDSSKECMCSTTQILAYQKRLSGPLLDRIDIILNVSKLIQNDMLMLKVLNKTQHSKVLNSIKLATEQQKYRYHSSVIYNSSLSSTDVKRLLKLSPAAKDLLTTASERLGLTARSYFKVVKVSQTIADLAGMPIIEAEHVSEALQFRGQLPT